MQTLLQTDRKMRSVRPPRRRRPKRWLRAAEYLLLAIGFVCLGIYGYAWLEGTVYQSYEDYELESSLKGEQASIPGYLRHLLGEITSPGTKSADDRAYDDLPKSAPAPNGPGPNAPAPIPRKPAPPPQGLVGRIEVPRVDVSAIVREGVDSRTLRRAAGHVPGTAMPGDPGNVAIAAHRDTFFRGLRDIRLKDTIRLTTPHGTYEYVVRSTQIVKPTAVEVLNPDRERELTLITCYPFNYIGHAPKRFIIKADQVDTEQPAAVFGADGAAVKASKETAGSKAGKSPPSKRSQSRSRRYAAKL